MNQQEPVRFYIDHLKEALLKVEGDYFRLVTTYNSEGIVRERVFCYELYHQIRLRIANQVLPAEYTPVRLHGESRKQGHPDFDKRDQKDPDFIFHAPGTHNQNILVVEVKGELTAEGISKDFATLTTFLKYQYQAGVFILFNHSFEQFSQSIITTAYEQLRSRILHESAEKIYILTIEKAKEKNGICEEHRLSDLRSLVQNIK